ncbi:Mu transposase C-terminal domain-containing protein [Candidatus Oscillochloris fontis]|uniref:Mu transposase C-terminal domain-containing protein n=1 Tax=Candidatus Oscillochloris fontis TaxID=2496868 RepID=UPI0013763C5A|nr:Mu transposase C-terminal domain-containing protein [Candidatus Oscillochloris fontis]
MARILFTIGVRYKLRGEVFAVTQILVGGMVQVENQSFGGMFTVAVNDLVTAWARGDLVFAVPPPLARKDTNDPLGTDYTYTDFQGLPLRVQAEAWRRYQIILPLLRQKSAERSLHAINAYVEALRGQFSEHMQQEASKRVPIGHALSRPSIWRWLSSFVTSGHDIRSLAPNLEARARKGETRLDREVEAIVTAVLAECAAHPMKRSVNDVYLMVVNRIAQENRTRPDNDRITTPGNTTVYRRIKSSHAAILSRRKSRLEEQADAPVDDGPTTTRVLERVEMDNTLLDLFVVDEEDRLPIGRPLLTYALDVHSGLPCGVYVGFEPASAFTASACTYHSIMPKPDVQHLYETQHPWPVFGLMETLVVDNGKDFVNADLRAACGQLGIILEQMPVRTPWFKGGVERFFRTNNTGLIHGLPGTSFSNVLERGDYEAMQHACISLTAFWKLLHIFLLDVYAQDWHTGKKAIPYKRWNESIQMGFLPVLHTSAEETRILLMRTEERVIQRAGIQFEWLFYRSPDLMRLRSLLPDGTEVRFKYDPTDISRIYVADPLHHRWLPVMAADQSYAQGLSLWKHRIINRFVQAGKRDVDIEALAAAKAHIQQIVAEEYTLTRTSRGRKTAARFLGVGVPEPHAPAAPPTLPAPAPALPAPQPEPQPDQTTPAPPTKPVRKPRQAKSTAPSPDPTSDPTPPPANLTDNLDDLDLSGWGGDYQLPPSSGDTR